MLGWALFHIRWSRKTSQVVMQKTGSPVFMVGIEPKNTTNGNSLAVQMKLSMSD